MNVNGAIGNYKVSRKILGPKSDPFLPQNLITASCYMTYPFQRLQRNLTGNYRTCFGRYDSRQTDRQTHTHWHTHTHRRAHYNTCIILLETDMQTNKQRQKHNLLVQQQLLEVFTKLQCKHFFTFFQLSCNEMHNVQFMLNFFHWSACPYQK